jgi:hypothetical protein
MFVDITAFAVQSLLLQKHIQRQQPDTDADQRIRHIEGRPVVCLPVYIQKVNHLA